MRKLLLLLVTLFLGMQVFAQTTVTGVVTDEGGDGIPGANVMVKGVAGVGNMTDFDGKYSVKVPEGATTLVYSFVGLETQEIEIAGKSVINVSLKSSSEEIETVMVVAYGTAKKSTFTGSVTEVKGEKLTAKNVSNISQALVGESAGVTVLNTNGQPGSSAKIRIRGFGSVNGNRDPLYVVDGVPLQGAINSINPSDIESTTILKDASATAIYGSRGANGVIIITTKQGKSSKSSIEVEAKYGVNIRLLPDYDVIKSPEKYMELVHQGLYNKAIINGEADPMMYANNNLFGGSDGIDTHYNMWNADGNELIGSNGKFRRSDVSRKYSPKKWSDELFESAYRAEAVVKLSGGADKTKYYTSFGYLDEKGYYLSSDYSRFTGRLNLNHQIRTWLKGSMNMGYVHSKKNFAGQSKNSTNGFWFVNNMPSIYPIYLRDEHGAIVPDNILGGGKYDFGGGQGFGKRPFGSLANPIATNTLDIDRSTMNQFTGNAMLEAEIVKGLKFQSRFGIEFYINARDNRSNPWYGGSAEQGGAIYKEKSEVMAFTSTNMLSYSTSIGSNNISAFVAHEVSSYDYKKLSGYKTNLVDPYGLEFNNAVVSNPVSSHSLNYAIESYFGQIKYDYNEKYFLQGVVRRDGSSRFKNNKWGTFGSVGLGWMLSKESFMDFEWLNELKIKSSYGVIGEQGGMGYYPGEDLYEMKNVNDKVSLSFKSKGNPDLTWEKSKMFQVGMEFEIFNRLSGSVDYYLKKTDDLFFQRRVSPSLGYAILNVNDGNLENSGIEVALNLNILKTNDLSVDFKINGAFQQNELTAMPIEPSTGKPKVLDIQGLYGRSEGHSLYDFYTREYAGVNPATGASRWWSYYNEVGGKKEYIEDMVKYKSNHEIGTIVREMTEDYNKATSKYVGRSAIPKVAGSFGLDVSYRGFDLGLQFLYSFGGYGYDRNYESLMGDKLPGHHNWHVDMLNAWSKDNKSSNIPSLTAGLWDNASRESDRFLVKRDYITFNSVNLGYTFPSSLLKKIGINSLRVFALGTNLWLASARAGYNPSTSETGSASTYRYQPLSSFTGGINIQF